ADLVIVRGPYARELCLADGIPASRLALAPAGPPPRGPTSAALPTSLRVDRRSQTPPASLRLRLAGLAAARHGVATALEVARTLDAVLVVRTGEGTEPVDLASLPNVAIDDDPVD